MIINVNIHKYCGPCAFRGETCLGAKTLPIDAICGHSFRLTLTGNHGFYPYGP